MKVDRLEAHDRLEHFNEDQSININQGAEDCLKKNTLSLAMQEKSPYVYLFAHPRTAEDGVTKVMFWQPRLTKPQAQTNSYLFRAESKSDLIEVCWLIPPEEMWGQYKKGNVTHSDLVGYFIDQYNTNKPELERPHPKDLSEEESRSIYRQIVKEKMQALQRGKLCKGSRLLHLPTNNLIT